MSTPIYKHLAKPLDWREAACGYIMTTKDSLPTQHHSRVTCPDCMAIVDRRRAGLEPDWPPAKPEPSPREKLRREWTVAAVGGETDLGFEDWSRGVGTPTPHTPPVMNENSDGAFIFYGTHSSIGGEMEVVPMTTGNVEFTIAGGLDGGLIFNLHHLDRADMIRALLHDFHYSPERGGPADDQD